MITSTKASDPLQCFHTQYQYETTDVQINVFFHRAKTRFAVINVNLNSIPWISLPTPQAPLFHRYPVTQCQGHGRDTHNSDEYIFF